MAEINIRPSSMLMNAKYALAAILAGVVVYLWQARDQVYFLALLAVPLYLALTATAQLVRNRFVKMQISGDRLKYEAGMASKTSRSIPLHKVQDVTVKQTFGQRILGLGDLSIETAGETSRLTIEQIASPRVVAEQILDIVARLNENKK
ncbi:MAG: PH domain-containing protein [Bryobacterales bacterium]|nr:PH domain-containing protein [Bryobacterales bacterium]